MEQSCYRCGAQFEEGVSFCPHCSAPQIRVLTQPGGQAAITSESSAPLLSYPGAPAKARLEWPEALIAALLATLVGLVLVVVSSWLGLLASGFLSVILYRRRVPFARLGPGLGARLGILSGAIAFAVFSASLGVSALLSRSWQPIRDDFSKAIQEASSRSRYPLPPQLMEWLQTPAGLVFLLASALAVFLTFATLGGVLGGVVLRRGKPPGIDHF